MQQFPSITEEEFHQGCQAFYETAVRASESAAVLQLAFHNDVLSIREEYLIAGSNDSRGEATDTIRNEIDELTDEEDHEVRIMMILLVEPDSAMKIMSRPLQSSAKDTILVEFSILRSPIYQVPVLWFTLNAVPSNALTGIEAIYQYLVPETTRPGLRQIGVMGGISMAVRRCCLGWAYC
jgi:Autophagocytosis associated protein, active-site domain